MRKEDMLKKIEAGESPVDISIEKYRELQCKVLDGEEITIDDIQGTTCALCHVYDDDWTCLTCPLHLANHGCRIPKSTWRNLSKVLNDFTSTKQQILNAMDDMISDLKDAKLYEDKGIKNMSDEELKKYEGSLDKTIKESEKDTYIQGQRECGLKIGDTVKVTRTAVSNERGWSNSWREEMLVNKTGKITRIGGICDEDTGIAVEIDDDWFYYPYFVLEKVEQKTYYVGQHFLYDNRDEYLLARIERNKVNLFNLSSGGKWGSHTTVSNDDKITEEEMKKLANRLHQWKDFTLVEE